MSDAVARAALAAAAPTVEQVAEVRKVLVAHRPGAISAGYVACVCDPSTWGSPGEFAEHQAEQVAALWGAR